MHPDKSPWFLLKFLRNHLAWASLSILLSSATIIFGVGLIGTSAYLISFAALQPSIAVLQVSIVGVRFFGLSKSIFRYLERLTSHKVNFKMLTNLRSWLFRQISDHFPDQIQTDGNAGFLSRMMEDVETLEFFFIRVINPPLTAIFSGLIVAILFRGFHISLVYTFLILLSVSILLSLGLSYLLAQSSSKGYMLNRSALHEKITEYIQGMPDLFVNHSASHQMTAIRQAEKSFASSQSRVALSTGLSNALVTILTQASMLVMLIGSILLINGGVMDPKLLAACALITIAGFDAIQPLPLAAQQLVLNEQAGNRILDLVTKDEVKEHEQIRQTSSDDASMPEITFIRDPSIHFEQVSFHYPESGREQIQGVSFSISAGQSIAIVGPSGAGKTSLAKLLLDYWQEYTGQIHLGELDYQQLLPAQIRSVIAYSGQGAYFFNTSLKENLLLANPQVTDELLVETLQVCQLGVWLQELPEGLNTQIGERGMKMSEGERRRLDVARTILRNCPVIILDEPFAGLDSQTESALTSRLREYLMGKSVIWITHRLGGLDQMDDILVMDQGKIIQRGSQESLLAQEGLFKQMWANQRQLL